MQPRANTLLELTAEIPVWETAQAKRLKAEQRKVVRNNTRRLNVWLYDANHNIYHDGVPLSGINEALVVYGFEPLEPMILCGRVGSLNADIGHNRFLTLSWYKMDSGRYEVVAYAS